MKLQLISPPQIDDIEKYLFNLERLFVLYNIGFFQLRLKNLHSSSGILDISIKSFDLCKKYGVKFLINDFIDIAKEINCDGVHLGENDCDIFDARKILGTNKIVGISCYNDVLRAKFMANNGASYVSFGAFFETKTKMVTRRASFEILNEFASLKTDCPVCVIGGIELSHVWQFLSYEVQIVAMCSGLWNLV